MMKLNKKEQKKTPKINRIPINNKRKVKSKIIQEYFLNHIKEYATVGIMFLIGIFLGVMYINNSTKENKLEIEEYINTYIQNFKNTENINYFELTKTAIQKNIILAILLWFAGTTIIGIPIVLGIILFRGGCLGYTIATCINTFGLSKGLSFILITIFIQNIILIPAIISIGVSCINLYKAIVKDRKKESIKIEIIKHTLISTLMMICLIISGIIEINISCKILKNFIKYF